MALAKFVTRGSEQYHRIDSAKVRSVTLSDDDDEKKETELVSLLNEEKNENVESLGALKHCQKQKVSPFDRRRKALPMQLDGNIKIRIHKMDNSSFVLEVPRKATVSDLKREIQNKFEFTGSHVSWPHVWGNFCLSFNNQKLLDDTNTLYQLGVRDSDELFFVRHLTASSGVHERRGFFRNIRRSST